MNTNDVLRDIRATIARYISARYGNSSQSLTTLLEQAELLVDNVDALDMWITDGGPAPVAWQAKGSYPHANLLGKRVLMRSGVQGQVVAISVTGQIEVSNEHERNEHLYWFHFSEVSQILKQ